MSVSLLVGLLHYWNKDNIGTFPILDEIFVNFFGEIPRIFLDYLKIILNSFYVGQSIS